MIKRVFVLSVLFLFSLYYLPIFVEQQEMPAPKGTKEEIQEKTMDVDDRVYPMPVSGYEHYMNEPVEQYVARYGEPARIAPSGLGTEWWTYDTEPGKYVQLEVKDNTIYSIFVLGNQINTGPFRIGMSRENVYDETELAKEFVFTEEGKEYYLSLSAQEWKWFPLIQFENETFLMIFIHPENNEIYGLHYVSPQQLRDLNFYTVVNTETEEAEPVMEVPVQSPAVLAEKERQLYSYIEISRLNQNLPSLEPSTELNELAEEMTEELGKGELTFEEMPPTDEVDQEVESLYISGDRIFDTPTQFGLLFSNKNNRKVLKEPSFQSIALKVIDDDLLFLLK